MLPCVSALSTGLDATASRIIEASLNSVWLIYPDTNESHPKPEGVGYPDSEAYSFYEYGIGVILGMQAHPQQESIDTNTALFSATTGAPVVSSTAFVFMAPPAVESQMAYYESHRIAPVYLSGNETSLYWLTANGTLIPETITLRTSPPASSEIFVLEVFVDANSNFVFAGYGMTPRGSMAAAVFYKTIYTQLASYKEAYYIGRWSDANGNGMADPSDEYIVIASESVYPIPEFRLGADTGTVAALILVAAVSLLKRRSLGINRVDGIKSP